MNEVSNPVLVYLFWVLDQHFFWPSNQSGDTRISVPMPGSLLCAAAMGDPVAGNKRTIIVMINQVYI